MEQNVDGCVLLYYLGGILTLTFWGEGEGGGTSKKRAYGRGWGDY